jgi:hypothetical protein
VRLWTLHPRYLDAKGLVAVWREGLLARKVLAGRTRGYRHHPQLARFRAHRRPEAAIDTYLSAVWAEARSRGYRFDATKLDGRRVRQTMPETRGQLLYEWAHLLAKLRARDPDRYRVLKLIAVPEPHPLFRVVAGGVRTWEKVIEPPGRQDRQDRRERKPY